MAFSVCLDKIQPRTVGIAQRAESKTKVNHSGSKIARTAVGRSRGHETRAAGRRRRMPTRCAR